MILPFSTKMNGKPTYFVEKIWQSFNYFQLVKFEDTHCFFCQLEIKEMIDLKYLDNQFGDIDKGKLHTIREDKNDRWQVGTKIDFFINCRQKNMFRFAPVLPVVSIQEIEIIHQEFMNDIIIKVNGKKLNIFGQQLLAKNDGFDCLFDFLMYFREDFKGKIIHWTEFRY